MALATILSYGNVSVDTAVRSVMVGGLPIDAPRREVDLLENLLRRSGHVVGKAMLENSLYAMDSAVTPNALEAVGSRLRKRLAAANANVGIRTVNGVGYALLALAIAPVVTDA